MCVCRGGGFFGQGHGEARIKLHSSKAQNSQNNSFYPCRKEGRIPSSRLSGEADFLSLARKTEARGFGVEGLFSCDPPCLNSPRGCVQVGLETVKYNGCSVWPRGAQTLHFTDTGEPRKHRETPPPPGPSAVSSAAR